MAGLHDVSAAAGGLTLNDRTISGTVPAVNVNGGGFGGGVGKRQFRRRRPELPCQLHHQQLRRRRGDIGGGELGPLSSGKLSAGRTFTASDANAHVALVDASYATQHKLTTGSTIAVGNKSGKATNFKVVGIVSEPRATTPRTCTSRSRWRRTWPA